MDHIVQWLFTDPITASGDAAHPEQFHFWVPWIIFCALGLLVPFYYWVEGRRRFFGSHTLHKGMMDKIMNQLALIAFVGWFVMGARAFMDSSLFSWRVWRYGWLLWIAIVVGYWVYFMIRRYPRLLDKHRYQRTMQQYIPKSRRERRAAGAR